MAFPFQFVDATLLHCCWHYFESFFLSVSWLLASLLLFFWLCCLSDFASQKHFFVIGFSPKFPSHSHKYQCETHTIRPLQKGERDTQWRRRERGEEIEAERARKSAGCKSWGKFLQIQNVNGTQNRIWMFHGCYYSTVHAYTMRSHCFIFCVETSLVLWYALNSTITTPNR